MKKAMAMALACLLLTGCSPKPAAEAATPVQPGVMETQTQEIDYVSRFGEQTRITLSDEGIAVEGDQEAVYTSQDIIYYEDRDAYDSGNPYGEGEAHEKHTQEEAAAHTVVNITKPGAYVVTGKLSAGQIRVDLGDDAYEDPDAVVELILQDADITCTVAPAILFLNTYECDGDWSVKDAKPDVDTVSAGANLILEGENAVSGSHVAKIFKDKDGEKKLWKQDGAVYSYMSMNVYGPGTLVLHADNEGLDTELHLTINGGDISIYSDNDGINTNEDGVSVTTINAGSLHIAAGLGAEGDGIDSNGYLVINGGTVVSAANPAGDAGLDSDLGSYINGGTVIALGSTMDWAESDSRQVTMNLRFARNQSGDSAIVITDSSETPVFAYDPVADETRNGNSRVYMGAIISCPGLKQGQTYHVYTGGTITGEETGGICSSVSQYEGALKMQYTGTDVGARPGGMGNQMPAEGLDGEVPAMPEGMEPGQMPDGGFGGRGQQPAGMEGMTVPGSFGGQRPELPEGETFPAGMDLGGGPQGGFGGRDGEISGKGRTEFYMADKVNAFSGVTPVME